MGEAKGQKYNGYFIGKVHCLLYIFFSSGFWVCRFIFTYLCSMDNFVVSARKYRPVTFDSVVGQSHITTTLKNAISSGQLAQAFLFTGPRGVGKTTCARILAKTINCQNVSADTEPCNECTSCRNFAQNASFNIHELDAASNNSVEDIRNLIDQVRFPPQDGKYKVYIIDEVHMLSQAAFNAFLKTLEEPPSYAIFILATTEKHKILPTILSRCQIFDFNRIQIKDMASHLGSIAKKENIEAEEEALELIALKADGGLRDALSMFDLNVTFAKDRSLRYKDVLENLHVLDYDYYLRMTDYLYSGDLTQILLTLNEIISKGFDLHQFIVGLAEHFRNILICKNPETVHILEVSDSIKAKYLEQSKNLSVSFLLSSLSVASQTDLNFKAAKNQRLHVEVSLMKLSQINSVLALAELPEAEKKTPDLTVKAPDLTPTVTLPSAAVPKKPVGITGLKSLKSLQKKEETVAKQEVEVAVYDLNTPFTEGQAIGVLAEFFKQRPSPNERLIMESGYDIKGTHVHFKLPNTFLYSLFENLKTDLLEFMKRKLKNSHLSADAVVTAEETQAKPRTEQQKFEAMAEKNPVLWDLKKGLDLDLIF
jgi:DNA polymerase-3 subunit gamma/tau